MIYAFQIRKYWRIPGLLTIIMILLFMISDTHADPLKAVQAALPGQVDGWSAQSGDQIFDPITIFSYIDGSAEVYRAYNFRQCLSRRYTRPGGPTIILDIFDMGSAKDAYGVFTHDLDGAKVDIGQEGRLRPGWLSYWKDRFFISIYAEEESPAAQQAVRNLGRKVADGIVGHGTRPSIVSQLPANGLQADTIRYLHHPIVLNYHYYLADENILAVSAQTDVALAEYQTGDQTARLLLVQYPTPAEAVRSQASFLKHYLPDADKTGTALMENGKWAAVTRIGHLLAIVLESDSRQFAEHLSKEISKTRLPPE